MSEFQIRFIQKEDDPALAKLIRTVMTEFDCVGEGYSIEDPEVDYMYETYSTSRAAYFVLLNEQGKVCGGAGIGPLPGGEDSVCELKKMYFYPEARGKGMGQKLLNMALEKARSFGYTTCYLETVERMQKANRLYQAAGFKLLESRMGNTGHTACNACYAINLTQRERSPVRPTDPDNAPDSIPGMLQK